MEKLNELLAKREEIKGELSKVEKRIMEIKAEKYFLKVGDKVSVDGVVGVITRLEFSEYNDRIKPYHYWKKVRKDGGLHMSETQFFVYDSSNIEILEG